MSAASRVGQGFDLHRLVSGRPLKIGGVAVDSPVGAEAHSDGDVVLHALIDALLGAVGLDDIGELFPPDDATYKGADSLGLLEKALCKVKERTPGFRVENIDITILLEKPKLGPYKPVIRERIATALGLEPGRVAVKAKTMEGLGPIGQQEAIAAMVTLLISLPAS